MRTANYSFLIFLFIFTIACNPDEKQSADTDPQVTQLADSVMDVHDDAMLEMDEMMRLKRSLRRRLDSLPDSTQQQPIYPLIQQLESADSAMMQWMQDYEPDMKDKSRDEKVAYLRREQEKILRVQNQMRESIRQADTFLQEK